LKTGRVVACNGQGVHDAVHHTTTRFSVHRCDVEDSFHVAKSSVVKIVLHSRSLDQVFQDTVERYSIG